MSDVATRAARAFLGVSLQDPMSGFFVIHRQVFERSRDRLSGEGYKILLELLVRGRVQAKDLVEIPYVFKDRKQGYSKLSAGVIFQYVKQLICLGWSRVQRKRPL